MENDDLHSRICDAMLAWLTARRDQWAWSDDGSSDEHDRPAKVTGWEDTPYTPATCDTCGPEWARVIIHYLTADGEERTVTIMDDFGEFINALCDKEEQH